MADTKLPAGVPELSDGDYVELVFDNSRFNYGIAGAAYALGAQRAAEAAQSTHHADASKSAAEIDMSAELRRLHAEVEALRSDKALLDSGRIMTSGFDALGESYQTEWRGLDLRAAISAAIAASKE